jgi:FixJ family two-component response regulator
MTDAIVHVVDDDRSVRSSLVRLLRTAGLEARAYGSAGEFLLGSRREGPGCIVLDVSMPGPSGLELHEALMKQGDTTPVVFLSGRGDIPMTVRAMKGGAVDFLTKPVKSADLLGAVRTALARDAENRERGLWLRDLRARHESLTEREREVFARVTEGKLNKQIAAELGTSERTIKAHRARVMQKMQVKTVAELIRAADQLEGVTGRA